LTKRVKKRRSKAAADRSAAPVSLRAYARRRGVSAEAVSKAVSEGRLAASVVRVRGAPKIADVELADREWEANTRPRVDLPPDARAAGRRLGVDEAVRDVLESAVDEDVPDYFRSRALREAAAARREKALADMAEIEVEERRGELVKVDAARAGVIEKFTVVKTKILGVPSRVAQRLPHVSADDLRVIDDLLREALEELADGADGDGEEDSGDTAA
jgi:phage terminase Nu1 subunit (DNA packaging protein)